MRTKQEIASDARALSAELGDLSGPNLLIGKVCDALSQMIRDLAMADESKQHDLVATLRADVERLTRERDSLKESAARDAQGFGREVTRLRRIALSHKLDIQGSLAGLGLERAGLERIAARNGFKVVWLDDQRIEVLRDDLTEFVGDGLVAEGFLIGWERCTNRMKR